MNKISFILTTLNEEKTIHKIINKIRTSAENYEIIIIDDQSTDQTIEIINNFKDQNIKYLIRDFNSGLGSAIVTGIFHTSGNYICWLDVSMDYHVINVINAVDELQHNDIVLFSRYIKGGKDLRSFKRSYPSFIINFFARLVLTKKISDYTGGIFLYKREILKNIIPLAIGHGNYFIDFIYRCYNNNLKIKQLPIIYKKDVLENKSETFKNIFSFTLLGLRYLVTILLSRLKKYVKI